MDNYITAQDPETLPECVSALARDKSRSVRRGVAMNPNTPTEVLAVLAEDDDERVVATAQEQLATRPQSTIGWMMGGGV